MKLGINSYTFMWSIGFEGARPGKPLSAKRLLEKAAELGVEVVQVGPNLLLGDLDDQDLDEFVQIARMLGIELELGTRGLETEHLTRQIALCKRIGSGFLRTIPEIGGKSLETKKIPGYLRQVLPLLEAESIKLGIENGMIPAEELKWVFDEVNSPLVGAVLDTANSMAIPEGWRQVAKVLAPYTMNLHLKEFIVKRMWHMMGFICEGKPLGQGQLDLPWLMEVLKSSSYDFNIIIELWPPEQKTLQETIRLEHAWAKESVAYARLKFQPGPRRL